MKNVRAQAAVDFMVAYGIALLALAIAIYVILSLGVFTSAVTPTTCYPSPSFSCDAVSYNGLSGNVTIVFTQALGGTINITGAACSSTINAIGGRSYTDSLGRVWNTISGGPAFGNYQVQPYSNVIFNPTYPTNALQYGEVVYSGNSGELSVNCYDANNGYDPSSGVLSDGPAKVNIGTSFSGYIWFNYTIANLPTKYHAVQQVAQFTTTSS